jgi:hypothetical protein
MTNFENLTAIVEAIKIRYPKPLNMKFTKSYAFRGGGFVSVSADVNYQIIGAYPEKDQVITVILIDTFDCWDILTDLAIKEFKIKIKKQIGKRIPEAVDIVDILLLSKEVLKSEQEKRI